MKYEKISAHGAADVGVMKGAALLLYDAECGLCDAVVRWVLKKAEKRGGPFYFAPLHGKTARGILQRAGLADDEASVAAFDSLVFLPAWNVAGGRNAGSEIMLRSDGVLGALNELGGGWRFVARVLRIFPRGLRDFGYRCVARVRRRIFGSVKPGCSIAESERGRASGRFLV